MKISNSQSGRNHNPYQVDRVNQTKFPRKSQFIGTTLQVTFLMNIIQKVIKKEDNIRKHLKTFMTMIN